MLLNRQREAVCAVTEVLAGPRYHLVDENSASNASAANQVAVGQGTIITHHQHLYLHLRI